MAKHSYNFTLYTSTTSGGSYTKLCVCRMINMPELEKGKMRTDTLEDAWLKQQGGKKQINDVQFEALLDDTNRDAVYAHFDTPPGAPNRFYQIRWSLESGESTPEMYQFEGFLQKMGGGNSAAHDSDDAMSLPFTIAPSGAVTIVAAT